MKVSEFKPIFDAIYKSILEVISCSLSFVVYDIFLDNIIVFLISTAILVVLINFKKHKFNRLLLSLWYLVNFAI